MRLLKLDPVFDELRGWNRLRIWSQDRVRDPIRVWLMNWNIIKPDYFGSGTIRSPRKRR